MKAYGGVHIYIYIFLTSALAGGEWSASLPGRFTPGERAPGTRCIGCWMGPRAGLNHMEKRKFLTLLGLELDSSVVQPIASRYTDCAIPASSAFVVENTVNRAKWTHENLHAECRKYLL
jgi:hypothetical protein